MRLVGYPRVSTEEQDFAVQVAKIQAYASLKDLDLVEMVTLDEGNSGKSLNRPGVNRVLELLDSGQADGVIVYKLDRLTRNLEDWCRLIREYFGDEGGKVLMSVTDNVDTNTANGRMFLNFLIMAAQWERETISERTRLHLRHKRSLGQRTGSVPYGKQLDPGDPRRSKIHEDGSGGLPIALVDNPAEIAMLGMIQDLYRVHGTYRRVAAELDRAGFKTKSGRPWRHTTVRKILMRSA